MDFSGKGKAALGCKNQYKDGTSPDNPSGSSMSMRPLVSYSRQPKSHYGRSGSQPSAWH